LAAWFPRLTTRKHHPGKHHSHRPNPQHTLDSPRDAGPHNPLHPPRHATTPRTWQQPQTSHTKGRPQPATTQTVENEPNKRKATHDHYNTHPNHNTTHSTRNHRPANPLKTTKQPRRPHTTGAAREHQPKTTPKPPKTNPNSHNPTTHKQSQTRLATHPHHHHRRTGEHHENPHQTPPHTATNPTDGADHGVRFTSWDFSRKLQDAGLAPSMGAVGVSDYRWKWLGGFS